MLHVFYTLCICAYASVQSVTLHTTLGDIKLELFCEQVSSKVPRTWFENALIPGLCICIHGLYAA